MSYASNDIHGGGPGGNAEPSMEEILASIRRILKEDEPGKQPAPAPAAAAPPPPRPVPRSAPVPEPQPAYTVPPDTDMDDDVLLLDASMIARPADYSSATALPTSSMPSPAAQPLPPAGPEPLHFSSEPAPFSRDFDHIPRAMPEPVVELPPTAEPAPEPVQATVPEPAAFFSTSPFAATQYTAPPEPAPPPEILAEPEPAAYRPLQPPSMPALPDTADPAATASSSASAAPAAFWEPPEPVIDRAPAPVIEQAPEPEHLPEPPAPFADPPRPPLQEPEFHSDPLPAAAFTPDTSPTEPEMNDTPIPGSFDPPESLISDKTTDAAASSIGALVRSMTTEKSVTVSKSSSITIEDIVREEIRPLLKVWLDAHLPTLVERIVRSEIERVINRSVL